MMLYKIGFDEENAAFQALRRREFAEPEKQLMLAILEDALRCRENYVYAKDGRGKKLFREAEEWLLSETEDWVFSFSHVCEVLGCNPSYLRKRTLRWKEEQLAMRSETRGLKEGVGRGAAQIVLKKSCSRLPIQARL